MRQIDITAQPQFFSVIKAQMITLWFGWPRRVLGFTPLLVLACFVIYDKYPDARYLAWLIVGALALVWTVILVRYTTAAVKYYRGEELRGRRFEHFYKYINDQGLGIESDEYEIFFRWSAFEYMIETRNFIFLTTKPVRVSIIVFKSLLPPETSAAVIEVISKTQIENKKFHGKPWIKTKSGGEK
ncbi:hypothetical protein STSP2_00938 [Anaerohalosphaera lusitana]|uniref:YcxB-like C-terminal domain-containing protein n=1 Tax=Anaerohalosphaera lusitana TaxID=1936003 RepID=A0A1U9NIN3_9BACT|nr:YcxB family protein [Anaerohalosphaera lusitana]AQT67789.1 hypothetical protein STSP2_00938 [Anaerohalosphaera lusitana]